MAEVKLKKVRKKFGETLAVSNIDLDIEDGEFVVLVGPSGCGKSTTLRMIAGLEETTGGEIFIGERMVNDLEPKDRNIAMVFQNYALYPHKNVFDNIAFGLKARKMEKGEIERRVRWASKVLGVEDLLKRKPKQLSGGQMQRVALGRAIVREPDVFLLDEPLSNLDAKLRVKMRAEISKLHKELKVSTVYVTHDQVEAMTLGDRIVIMKDGLVQQIGTPLEAYDRPENRFVAGFIGSPEMNFMDGTMHGQDMDLFFKNDEVAINMTGWDLGVSLDDLFDREVILGIRPEHILMNKGRESEYFMAVEVVEQMGAQTLAFGKLNDTVPISALFDRNDSLRDSDKVALQFDIGSLHLFDKETGATLRKKP
jgi:ABC-type sugar transport system ATPase subunit